MAESEVEAQTRIRHALLENGYVPLANVDKRCMLRRWPSLEVDHDVIDDWADRRGLRATGVRIEGDMLAFDFDIDDEGMLDRIWDAVWKADEALGALLDSMPLRAGKGAKVCLFGRLDTGKIDKLWSKAYYRPGERETGALHRLEVFTGGSGGRQIGVYGVHSTDDDGEVAVTYRWADGRGLLEVPLEDLPRLRRKDVFALVDIVSREMDKAGWDYEVSARHGKITETRSYTLVPTMRFTTNGGDVLDLAGLEGLAGDGGLRASLGFVEAGAVNTSRGLVGVNPVDGRVQIWDSATATLYRPADLDLVAKLGGIGAGLQRRGLLTAGGEPAVSGPTGHGEHVVSMTVSDFDAGEAGHIDVLVGGDGRLVVPVGDGELTEATWLVGRWLASQDDLYQRGGAVTGIVRDNDMLMMETSRLAVEIGGRVCCVREERAGGSVRMVEVDPPVGLVRQVGAVVGEVGFRELRGVVDTPVVRRDGSFLLDDGWDKESGLLVRAGGRFSGSVPDVVDRAGAVAALEVLMAPFRAFPFADATSRGAFLAALLTAVVRPSLDTAPAFALDAPAAGSGKTLLGQCLMALAGGGRLYAPLPVKKEDEVAKVLLSVLMEKPRAALFDNQVGLLDSASLAAVLTSARYSGRVLGETRQIDLDTGLLVLFSGNNMTVVGDMTRRVLNVRIDPACEAPAMRRFDFDPLREVRTNRDIMLAAALTLVRWGMSRPDRTKGRVGSFEMWDEVVGQTVAALRLDEFADPVDSLLGMRDADPRLEMTAGLLFALREFFGSCWFKAADVMDMLNTRRKGHDIVQGVLDDSNVRPSVVSIGLFLRYRKDTRVEGLCLRMTSDSGKRGSRFRIESGEDSNVVGFDMWRANKAAVDAGKTDHIRPPK